MFYSQKLLPIIECAKNKLFNNRALIAENSYPSKTCLIMKGLKTIKSSDILILTRSPEQYQQSQVTSSEQFNCDLRIEYGHVETNEHDGVFVIYHVM